MIWKLQCVYFCKGYLTLLNSEQPKLHRVLTIVSAVGIRAIPGKQIMVELGFTDINVNCTSSKLEYRCLTPLFMLILHMTS